MAASAGKSESYEFDSAGTHGYHVGDAPDQRAMIAGLKRGYDLSSLRARKVDINDFADFDLLLVMDNDNYSFLVRLCPSQYRDRVKLLLEFSPSSGIREIPDPYYGEAADFELVIDLAEQGIEGLLGVLR